MRTFAYLKKTPAYASIPEDPNYGMYNGYVAIHKEDYQKYAEKYPVRDYADYGAKWPKVHGDVTYGDKYQIKDLIISITAIPENLEDYEVIGFDTLHPEDTQELWNYETVKAETLRWREEIIKNYERL